MKLENLERAKDIVSRINRLKSDIGILRGTLVNVEIHIDDSKLHNRFIKVPHMGSYLKNQVILMYLKELEVLEKDLETL
jgi:hypothetical protein